MESIYGENWGIVLIVSIIITWSVGLFPPLLIRFVILRRPMGRWAAIGTVCIFWVFNLVFSLAMGSTSKTHGALVLVAIVSFYLLRKKTIAAGIINKPRHQSSDWTSPFKAESNSSFEKTKEDSVYTEISKLKDLGFDVTQEPNGKWVCKKGGTHYLSTLDELRWLVLIEQKNQNKTGSDASAVSSHD